MNDIAEYERRISAALSRIAYGIETLQARPVALDVVVSEDVSADEAALIDAPATDEAPVIGVATDNVAPEPLLMSGDDVAHIEAPETEISDAQRQSLAAEAQSNEQTMALLRTELESERAANSQLSERVRAIREKQETTLAALERKLGQVSRTAEASSGEITRLKRANAELIEINSALLAAAGAVDPGLVNRSMQAELEALRAARSSDALELAELMAVLEPLAALAQSDETTVESPNA
jgi:transcriptional regulator with XRE-family HTH domain